jgi:hypothetical protein
LRSDWQHKTFQLQSQKLDFSMEMQHEKLVICMKEVENHNLYLQVELACLKAQGGHPSA